MWADNEAAADYLNVKHLVAGVTTTVRTDRLLPVTVGVYGDWGSGKSTVLAMVREELKKDDDCLVVWFNGWQFEGYEDAKAALMGNVLDEILARQGLLPKARDLGKKLLKRVDWFRLLGWAGKSVVTLTTGLPAFGAGAIADAALSLGKKAIQEIDIDEAEKLLREKPPEDDNIRQTVREFKKDFEELLEESKIRRLVVIIDDLDRCLPPTIIETLEAIRLFLFVPRSAFILGADEDLVRQAVALRFPEARGTSLDVGLHYLEKLVQVPVRVTALGAADARAYIQTLFVELHLGPELAALALAAAPTRDPASGAGMGITYDLVRSVTRKEDLELRDDLGTADQIADILTAGLAGNPRQIKRFLNALLLRVEMAAARGIQLRRRVLAKLMLLEYIKTPQFRLLGSWLGPDGSAPPLAALEDAVRTRQKLPPGKTKPEEERTPPPARKKDGPTTRGSGQSKVTIPETSAVVGAGATGSTLEPSNLPPEAAAWIDSPWFNEWLGLDPPLGREDLRPYFYFSQDRVGPLAGAIKQLSPAAQLVLSGMESDALARRRAATLAAADLSPAEAVGVFDVLLERARRTEDFSGTTNPLSILVEFTGARPELFRDLLLFTEGLEDQRLGGGVPSQFALAVRSGADRAQVSALLSRWAKSPHPPLAAAASAALKAIPAGPAPGPDR